MHIAEDLDVPGQPQRWPSNTEHVVPFTKVLWTGWVSNGMSDSLISTKTLLRIKSAVLKMMMGQQAYRLSHGHLMNGHVQLLVTLLMPSKILPDLQSSVLYHSTNLFYLGPVSTLMKNTQQCMPLTGTTQNHP